MHWKFYNNDFGIPQQLWSTIGNMSCISCQQQKHFFRPTAKWAAFCTKWVIQLKNMSVCTPAISPVKRQIGCGRNLEVVCTYRLPASCAWLPSIVLPKAGLMIEARKTKSRVVWSIVRLQFNSFEIIFVPIWTMLFVWKSVIPPMEKMLSSWLEVRLGPWT